jgi:RNA polymerase sigma-70 factor (sigma-E family)
MVGLSTATADDLPDDAGVAVRALFVAHHSRLVGYARLLVDDQSSAEDLVQEAFVSLHRRWPLRDKGAAVGYLRTAVAHGAADRVRRLRVARRADEPQHLPEVPSAEVQVLADEDHRAVLEGLSDLPLRQRQVLVLRYYLDLSEAQIADLLQISKGSVKAHASRALATLGARLEAAR